MQDKGFSNDNGPFDDRHELDRVYVRKYLEQAVAHFASRGIDVSVTGPALVHQFVGLYPRPLFPDVADIAAMKANFTHIVDALHRVEERIAYYQKGMARIVCCQLERQRESALADFDRRLASADATSAPGVKGWGSARFNLFASDDRREQA